MSSIMQLKHQPTEKQLQKLHEAKVALEKMIGIKKDKKNGSANKFSGIYGKQAV